MRLIKKYFLFSFFVCLFLSQGCAVGNKYNFSEVRAELQISTADHHKVSVASLDRRDVVLSGTCAPTYVGMQRAGFGNPWRVNTESGLPFAEDVTKAVAESLSKRGFSTIPVNVSFNQTEQQVTQVLLEKKTDRSLFLIIKKWESDTYVNIGLDYDLRLMVMGPNQSILAEISMAETKSIPGSFWNPPAAAKEEIPKALKQILEKLLNDPKITEALK